MSTGSSGDLSLSQGSSAAGQGSDGMEEDASARGLDQQPPAGQSSGAANMGGPDPNVHAFAAAASPVDSGTAASPPAGDAEGQHEDFQDASGATFILDNAAAEELDYASLAHREDEQLELEQLAEAQMAEEMSECPQQALGWFSRPARHASCAAQNVDAGRSWATQPLGLTLRVCQFAYTTEAFPTVCLYRSQIEPKC